MKNSQPNQHPQPSFLPCLLKLLHALVRGEGGLVSERKVWYRLDKFSEKIIYLIG